MGAIYCGPYADTIGYDDHEGYAARILPDGTHTATVTHQTRHFLAYQACCACGWADGRYPATDTGGTPRSTNGTTTTSSHSCTR